jgi:hypothetical protein
MHMNLTPDERAQRAWINNEPGAQSLAELADAAAGFEQSEDDIGSWQDVAERCIGVAEQRKRRTTDSERLDEIVVLLRTALADVSGV